MGERGHDFLDMMGDKNEGGGFRLAAEAVEELEKLFAGNGVEAGAGFVEDEEFRFGHQGAADENALAFALGEVLPRAVSERKAFNAFENGSGGTSVRRCGSFPKIDHGVFAADDRFECGLGRGHEFVEGAADETNFFTQFGPMTFAIGLAEELDVAIGGGFVAGDGREQGGFAGTVGAEDRPMLAGIDTPIDAVENDSVAAFEAEVADRENGAAWHTELLTGEGRVAKRKFRLPTGMGLLGLRLNLLT